MIVIGYISKVGDNKIYVTGCDPQTWKALSSWHFTPGICKHVSRDKTDCTIKVGKNTICIKNNDIVEPENLQSCYCRIVCNIQKYKFNANNKKIEGWVMRADSIRMIKIPI